MNILITGVSGFIGSALLQELVQKLADTDTVIGCVREGSQSSSSKSQSNNILYGEFHLTASSDWSEALRGKDVVIHCAAKNSTMAKNSESQLDEYRAVNLHGSINLAKQAMQSGVKRFIFLSSVKVNGELTERDQSYINDDIPAPEDAYGQVKHETEQALKQLCEGSAMELVIIRPPLVYGLKAKGNVGQLLKLVSMGVPLPFGGIDNKRSAVSIENLCSLIHCCLTHPKAAGQTLMVADGQDYSTSELLRMLAAMKGGKVRLFWIPRLLFYLPLKLLGMGHFYQRLFLSLRVDISGTKKRLGWEPLEHSCSSGRSRPSSFIRVFDFIFSFLGLLFLSPLILLVVILCYFDTGRPIFAQQRVGRNKKLFTLYKFRTMKLQTKSVGTHLVDPSSVTRLGNFLRKTKLDELPQLWNVLKGEMSLVGPRPCLANQQQLIDCRQSLGVFAVRPGVTGLAQVNNVDMSTPEKLAQLDAQMIRHLGLTNYFRYIFLTLAGKGQGDALK